MNQPADTLRIVKEGNKEAERYRRTIAATQPAGDFERAFGAFGRALDNFMPSFIETMKKVAEILTTETYEDYQIRKWLSQVPHGGMVGDNAVLIVYNEKHPSASYILVEDIKI